MTSKEQIEIQANVRKQGKHFSRALRRDRKVPAVVYGAKVENLNFAINEIDVTRYNRPQYENTIFVLKSDDSKINNLKVLKKDVQFHPVTHRPEHVDFFVVDMMKKVRVHVEIKFEGKPQGVRDGGVFNATLRQVEVECLPTDIPEFFSIDVSEIGLDENIHVSDLAIPDSVKLLTAPERTLATVAEVREEAEAPAPAEGEAAEGAAAAPAEGEKKAEEAKAEDKK